MIFKDMVAVLTGAGRVNGVGAATAQILASMGCNILINCLKNESQANQVIEHCKKYNVDGAVFIGDLTKSSNCREMASLAKQRWGKTHIVVNCLGITKGAPYEKLDALNEDDFNNILATNVTAPYLIAQAFQPLLKESSSDEFTSALVNISSAAAISGQASSIAYAAAKGAENTLTLGLAKALSPEVRVNAVCPSFINSSWWEESFADKQDKYSALINSVRSGNLLNKVLTPEDVAKTIVSIIENQLMTGEIIRLDAGAHIGKANPREQNQLTKTL